MEDSVANPIKLSILICSLEKRRRSLSELLKTLNPQINKYVEVLVETDNGQASIGAKRNHLLRQAKGEYVAFVDDDDMVSLDYVEKIFAAIKTSPDCCSLMGEISHFMGPPKHRERVKQIFLHSIEYDHWYEENGIYYRSPNHLNAIKRELALQIGFVPKNFGEDHDFSLRIQPLLKTEEKIEGTIYFYFAS